MQRDEMQMGSYFFNFLNFIIFMQHNLIYSILIYSNIIYLNYFILIKFNIFYYLMLNYFAFYYFAASYFISLSLLAELRSAPL